MGCAEGNPDVRVLCTDGGVAPSARAVGAENCALGGQTCAPTLGGTVCSGEPTGDACTRECDDNSLHWCAAAGDGGLALDRGMACTSNGAMECGAYPSKDSRSVGRVQARKRRSRLRARRLRHLRRRARDHVPERGDRDARLRGAPGVGRRVLARCAIAAGRLDEPVLGEQLGVRERFVRWRHAHELRAGRDVFDGL